MSRFIALPVICNHLIMTKRLATALAICLFFMSLAIQSSVAAIGVTRHTDSLLRSVATEMQQILEVYRTNRDIMELFINRYGTNAPVVQHIKRQFRVDDSVTLIKILSIVNTYGWKGKAHFGEAAPLAIVITFMHANLSYQKKYFPLMEDAAKKGNLPAEGFAIIADRIALYDSGQQIYGTQFSFSRRAPVHYTPMPITGINEIDQRRAQLKLEPYQQFIKNYTPGNLRQYCMY